MEFPLLDTERLSLIQMDKRHSESFFNIMSREQVTKYYGMNSLCNIQEAEQIMESFQEVFNSKSGRLNAGIGLGKSRGIVTGDAQLYPKNIIQNSCN